MYSPVADRPETSDEELADRVEDLGNKRVGLLWNARKSARVYLEVIEERLAERYPGMETTYYSVDTLIDLTDEDVLTDIGAWADAETDACITAIGECGSCTKFLTYGTNAIEETGTPAVGLVKSGFELDWQTNSKDHGRPLRYYAIDEGENVIDKAQIRQHVTDDMIDAIVDQLSTATSRDTAGEASSVSP